MSAEQREARRNGAVIPKRKICVVTGSRAEYGLLYWLLKEIMSDPDLELQLIVTGSHLSPEFGNTHLDIERDGFTINHRIAMLVSSDSSVAVSKSMALGVIGIAEVLDHHRPDLLVVLGDRFEILAAAQAALVARIPVAHIHGGEVTVGAFDDAIRHSITKMSHLHFAAAEDYRRRIIQLGEAPEFVFTTGAIGLDNLERLATVDEASLTRDLGLNLSSRPLLLCTFHPATLESEHETIFLRGILEAFDRLGEATIVFTKANADPGGRAINRMIDEWVAGHEDRSRSFVNLGQARYLSLMRIADVVVGNSSSGIVEAPVAGTPTVNVGSRQLGRLRAVSVINCGHSSQEIEAAIRLALTPEFRRNTVSSSSPFGQAGASAKIKRILKEVPLNGILKKAFHDVEFELGGVSK